MKSIFMKNTFEFYRDYHNIEEAKAFIDLLDANGIEHSLETSDTVIDTAIIGHGFIPKAILKIKNEDFQKVNALLTAQINEEEDYSEHYLSQLNDDELKEIFSKPEEWTVEDTAIARLILKKRGIEVSNEEISNLREEKLAITRKGKKPNLGMVLFYAACILFGLFIHLLFYIGGMGMAFYFAYGRSTDIDGQKHYTYETQTRKYGKLMFYGGFVVLILIIFFASIILNYSTDQIFYFF